jgi:hypothetical protein
MVDNRTSHNKSNSCGSLLDTNGQQSNESQQESLLSLTLNTDGRWSHQSQQEQLLSLILNSNGRWSH